MNYRYAVIGNGRLAKHMMHYFDMLEIPYTHWYRNSVTSLAVAVAQATHVLLMISDASIEPFLDENNHLLTNAVTVHFSGAHESDRAFSAHPLMTFSHVLYEEDVYREIPFVTTQEGLSFDELLPGLSNLHYAIPHQQKAYYHALCVMANNFSTLLWEKAAREFALKFNIPKHAMIPIMRQTFVNVEQADGVLTGPLVRNDQKTIQANLTALESDPFYAVYQGFLKAYAEQENQ